MPHGLWSVTRDQIFGFLRNESFNAVRLPFSTALALTPNKKVNANTIEPELHNLTAIELMGNIIDKAAEYDILIMLDMHRLNEDFIPELWYDDKYTMKEVKQAWDNLLTAFGDRWNLFAIGKFERRGEGGEGGKERILGAVNATIGLCFLICYPCAFTHILPSFLPPPQT